MQKHDPIPEYVDITPSAKVATEDHGWRAKCLQRLVRLDMPVPKSVALPAAYRACHCRRARRRCCGHSGQFRRRAADFRAPQPGQSRLGRAGDHPEHRAERQAPRKAGRDPWRDGGRLRSMCDSCSPTRSMSPGLTLMCSKISSRAPAPCAMSCGCTRLRPTIPFRRTRPHSWPKCLRAMARAWEGTSARLLRQAKGAPDRGRRWAWWCRKWRKASGRGFPALA